MQLPSDSPGTFIHRYASTSGVPVSAVSGRPMPRPGGLHRRPELGRYWYEIMLGVGLRVMVCAGVSIGESSS